MFTNRELSFNTCMANAKTLIDSFNNLKQVAETEVLYALRASGRIDLENSVMVRCYGDKVIDVNYLELRHDKVCLYGTIHGYESETHTYFRNIRDIESFADLCTELGI